MKLSRLQPIIQYSYLTYRLRIKVLILSSSLILPCSQTVANEYSGSFHESKPPLMAKFTRRFWLTVKDSTRNLLRALGLSILSTFRTRRTLGIKREEQIKIAIRHSRNIALLRSLIHVLPIGIAIWEVVLNRYTYYVGSIEYNQVYYQFGAKIHEMMIQASLAAVVFSYVRHEMALGKGLPFGALFSGLQITQISYLWSMEFWGSLRSDYLSLKRKLAMAAVIVFCFILAVAAGPSSAILLIPRLDYWSAGSTNIWINVTAEELWPNR